MLSFAFDYLKKIDIFVPNNLNFTRTYEFGINQRCRYENLERYTDKLMQDHQSQKNLIFKDIPIKFDKDPVMFSITYSKGLMKYNLYEVFNVNENNNNTFREVFNTPASFHEFLIQLLDLLYILMVEYKYHGLITLDQIYFSSPKHISILDVLIDGAFRSDIDPNQWNIDFSKQKSYLIEFIQRKIRLFKGFVCR